LNNPGHYLSFLPLVIYPIPFQRQKVKEIRKPKQRADHKRCTNSKMRLNHAHENDFALLQDKTGPKNIKIKVI